VERERRLLGERLHERALHLGEEPVVDRVRDASTPKKRSRKAHGDRDHGAHGEVGVVVPDDPRVRRRVGDQLAAPGLRDPPAIPSPTGNSSDLSTCSMNLARVVSLPFTWSGSGRCGGKRPSTATLRIMLAGVLSKMQALSAPVQRIEACTIRW
jgi:hypothetical protein